jgi:hypothetical protein
MIRFLINILSNETKKAYRMNGKPSYLYPCTSTHQTAHRTIARCNDDDDVAYSLSYFLLFTLQIYNKS